MARLTAALPALLCLLLLPAAQAHTAVESGDGRVRASVGLLDEPVSTYAVTGLDLCFTQNTQEAPRPPVSGLNPGNLSATLRSPSNESFAAALEIPFGRPNCVTFANPLVLTEPGQYLVDFRGTVDGSPFEARGVKAGGEVVDRAAITFPDTDVPSDAELRDELAAVRAEVAALRADAQDEDRGAPMPAAALLLAAVVALAAALRR